MGRGKRAYLNGVNGNLRKSKVTIGAKWRGTLSLVSTFSLLRLCTGVVNAISTLMIDDFGAIGIATSGYARYYYERSRVYRGYTLKGSSRFQLNVASYYVRSASFKGHQRYFVLGSIGQNLGLYWVIAWSNVIGRRILTTLLTQRHYQNRTIELL